MSIVPRFPIPRAEVVSRVPELLRLCKGKRVLHLGCADMPYTRERGEDLLHKQLSHVVPEHLLWGLDYSEEGVRHLKQMGFQNVLRGNVEDMDGELRSQEFEIILAGELIEHLGNPERFLLSVRRLMTDKTTLILTTVNATSVKGFIHSFLRQEKVHPDHNYYFSYHTLRQLLMKVQMRCATICYYQAVEGKGLARICDRGLALATRISPAWADGLIIQAVSQQESMESEGSARIDSSESSPRRHMPERLETI